MSKTNVSVPVHQSIILPLPTDYSTLYNDHIKEPHFRGLKELRSPCRDGEIRTKGRPLEVSVFWVCHRDKSQNGTMVF